MKGLREFAKAHCVPPGNPQPSQSGYLKIERPLACASLHQPQSLRSQDGSQAVNLDLMTIDLVGIADALATRRVQVPAYQRSYKWEKDHVEALFDDISNAIAESEEEYFLGSVVASMQEAEGERLEVVDGQQRLATTTILIAAIRDHFATTGDTDRTDGIESKYLLEKDIWSKEITPRLKLNDGDHAFFTKRVLSRPGSDERDATPTKESHRAIDVAANLAADHVSRTADLGSKPTERLRDLLDYLTKRAKIIWVTVPTHANAFVIFETLNDRGLDLAISDLLKNFLFLTAGDRISEVQSHWIGMFAVLEGAGIEADAVDYIRHLWSSARGATREAQLYSAIKKKIDSKQSAIDFAAELENQVKLYAAIQNPDHPHWKPLGPSTRGHMETINLLRMVQIRPLLLAVLAQFGQEDVKTTLRRMVSWGVRFLIVGGLGGGTLEKRYCSAAVKVRGGKINTAAELSKDLADVVPSDGQFESSFAVASVSYAYLARYYLRVLERRAANEKQPEWIPNPNQEEINLEHVLPRNPSAAWSHINPEVASAFARRIGNLALMRERMNALIGNDSFDEKRPHLAASNYELTAEMGKATSWGVDEIEARQRRLAELAVKSWPID